MDLIPVLIEMFSNANKAAQNGNYTLSILLMLTFTLPSIGLGIAWFLIKRGPKK